MNKNWIFFLIMFFALVLQLTFVPVFFDAFHAPDIPLMLMLAWTLRGGSGRLFIWPIGAGIIADLMLYRQVGTSALTFLLVAYCATFFAKRLHVEIRGTGVLWLLALVLLSMTIALIVAVAAAIAAGSEWRYMLERPDAIALALQFTFNIAAIFGSFMLFKQLKRWLVM